ncbi:MAG: AraC family transcriptional regulator [Bacteroidales bacterium]|nr:AraC family transcriptional regulator [Bacteroidales bacterium]
MIPKNKYQKEYIFRINKVVDYIDANIDKSLSLDILADVANFSPFHFHRIFTAFTGETLNNFVKRLRVEKAAGLLLNEPETPISEIAYYCGYNSASVFCRVFKDHFKISASSYRERMLKELSKIGQTESKIDKLNGSSNDYIRIVELNEKWRKLMKTNIEVKEMSALDLIYCRHIGQYDKIGKAYEKLFKWAGPRGLLNFPETKTVTVYHDDPKVTDIEKVRQSACITVDKNVKPEGEFGKLNVPAGKYAVGHFEIDVTEFEQAWNAMCIWVSESGYQPADENPYELYYEDPEHHPENKFVLDICIPVKPL